jgi:uncharacterized repeat protein (TIGR03837 family)
MTRRITLLCKIVDNLGDAGVSLRFARLWVKRFEQDEVCIWTDDITPFVSLLYGEPPSTRISDLGTLNVCEGRLKIRHQPHPETLSDWGDVVIEAFGTPLPDQWKTELSQRVPRPFWINLEYLSAEDWVEDCHGKTSTDPKTGWQQLFFFPGFTEKTGGLLGLESTEKPIKKIYNPMFSNKIFVFCYEHAPIEVLLKQTRDLGLKTEIATKHFQEGWRALDASKFDFVAQEDFDAALIAFRWLFVRGEDSFVRAQLAGVPMVWQIYPTGDGAHWAKLSAFFAKYSEGLRQEAKQALWNLWQFWNEDKPTQEDRDLLEIAMRFEPELMENALRWQHKIKQHCHLIDRLGAFLPPRN